MLIKDDELAMRCIGQQVIFGMAEPHETYLLGNNVDEKEPAYVVCGVVNEKCQIEGVIKPWSKLLIDYKRRGVESSNIYKMFSILINDMELVSYNNSIYAISRLDKDNFIVVGGAVVLFCNIDSGKITCSGYGDKSEIMGLDCNKLSLEGN